MACLMTGKNCLFSQYICEESVRTITDEDYNSGIHVYYICDLRKDLLFS